jgi:hypothetical protein
MNVNQLKQSRYLSRADVTKPVLLTMREVVQEDVSMESEPEKLRWVLYFNEAEKGLVLNATNGQIIAQFTGSEETDHWLGQKVVLYDDPSIMFGGKAVGGIRARQPRLQGQPPAATKPLFKPPGKPAAPAPQQTSLPTEFPEAAAEPDGENPF